MSRQVGHDDLFDRLLALTEPSGSPGLRRQSLYVLIVGFVAAALVSFFIQQSPPFPFLPPWMHGLAAELESLLLALLALLIGYYFGVNRRAATSEVRGQPTPMELVIEVETAKLEAARAQFEAAKLRQDYLRRLAELDEQQRHLANE